MVRDEPPAGTSPVPYPQTPPHEGYATQIRRLARGDEPTPETSPGRWTAALQGMELGVGSRALRVSQPRRRLLSRGLWGCDRFTHRGGQRCAQRRLRSSAWGSPVGAGMGARHPFLASAQDCGDLRRCDPAPLQRRDQRWGFLGRRTVRIVPHRPHGCGRRRGRPADTTANDSSSAIPCRSRYTRTDRELVGTGQMDTEAGEPLPTLMTQDPLGGAIHPPPHAMTTRVPDPQIGRGGQPETPADSPRVEHAQRITRLHHASECPTP